MSSDDDIEKLRGPLMDMINRTDQDSLDIQIGQMIRAIRTAKGWSQEDLAQLVGLSFQQVEKYENEHSRILASKLCKFASAFEIDVACFFHGPPQMIADDEAVDGVTVFGNDTWKLAAQFDRIESKETRKKILELVTSLAKDQ